jgi:hypothetical protein
MAAKNDITGASIVSKSSTKAYENGYDLIWGNKNKTPQSEESESEQEPETKQKE